MEYGLLGERLSHSHSPRIHRWLASYDYQLYPVSRDGLRKILVGRAFRGLNVTIPYKMEVVPYCDELTEEARALGCVNTLVLDPAGWLKGHNTDGFGLQDMARRAGIDFAGKKVLVLGSGGAGRTARVVAARLGSREVITVSRRGPVTYAHARENHADAELIVNATPVGMYPDNGNAPLLLADYPRCEAVLDMIYNPFETALLADARDLGLRRANGLWMLVAQAWRSAELFTGQTIPLERAEFAFEDLCRGLTNLVLLGMPGSGKSAMGRALAERMGRPFVDLDEWVERESRCPIPALFERQGEAAFRALESQAAAEAGKGQGLVIATGGGVVLRPENLRLLRQNGVLVWLRRDLDALALEGRPLSTDRETLRQMQAVRLPLYAAACDFSIDNQAGLDDCVRAVEERFHAHIRYQWAEPESAGHS